MTLQLLGDMSVNRFLARHWQKKPLVIRQAIAGFSGIVSISELLRLAARDDVESRLVAHRRGRWELTHGPLRTRSLRRMPPRNWTVLVQGVNLHIDAADRLLQQFSFIPRARLDDVMVSYAVPGGGVGPHVDSYDVFLLQGQGRRRWRIGRGGERRLVADAPIAVLAGFEWTHEWTLDAGDMLYLPPGWAHEGVALDECTTYSIGFRAPTGRDIGAALLTRLEESLGERLGDRRYRDRGVRASQKPGEIPASMVAFSHEAARRLRANPGDVEACLGEYLSEPKPQVTFDAPAAPLSGTAFARATRTRGVVLDRRSTLLYRGTRFFINGETVPDFAGSAAALRKLADSRSLPGGARLGAGIRKLLYGWYVHGWLHAGRSDGH
jgi:50S ribosomal protein L16 3-hydroxylase